MADSRWWRTGTAPTGVVFYGKEGDLPEPDKEH